MEPLGYLHNEMDVKILILFILSRIDCPISTEDLYETAYQDDSLNYFMFIESLKELCISGHILTDSDGNYLISDKGRTQGGYLEDSLAVPIVQKVNAAISRKLDQLHRESMMSTQVLQDENGNYTAVLRYHDGEKPLMSLSLMAPNPDLGEAMAKNLKKNIAVLYKTAMDCATDNRK